MKISRLIIENDFTGYLEENFLFGYAEALTLLTTNTKKGGDWEWMLEDYPKSKFSISIFSSKDNDVAFIGDVKETNLFTISAKRITMLAKAGAY